MYVAICPKCHKKVAVPRPGSLAGANAEDIKGECPFCGAVIDSNTGFEVAEPPVERKEFDLLSVG